MKTILAVLSLMHGMVWAQYAPQGMSFDGVLYNPNGTPVTQASVDFKLELLDKNGTCVLYSEEYLAQDLATTKGAFGLKLGSGTNKQNFLQGTTSFSQQLFQNSGTPTGTFSGCAGGVTMNQGDSRNLRVSYNLGSGLTALTPDFPVEAVPYSLVADTIQGKLPADFIQVKDDVSTDLNQTNVESIFSATNFAKLLQLLNNTYTSAYSFNNQRITGIADPTGATDAVNKNWTDSHVGTNTADFTGVGAGVGNGRVLMWNATTTQWVTGVPAATDATKLPLAGGTMTGAINMGASTITNLGTPTAATDAATKDYVDSAVSGGSQWTTSASDIFYNSGSVGIGTTTIAGSAKLDVYATGIALFAESASSNAIYASSNGTNATIDGVNNSASGIGVYGHSSSSGTGVIAHSTSGAPFKAWVGGGTEVFRVDSNGNVGIGTNAPSAKLAVSDGGSTGTQFIIENPDSASGTDKAEIKVKNYTTGYATSPSISLYNANGTMAAPSAVTTNDVLGSVMGAGYNGSGFSPGAGIKFLADQPWTGSTYGSSIVFSTTANGMSSMTERLRISNDGNVGIGTTTPSAVLDVNGSVKIGPSGTPLAQVQHFSNVTVTGCSSVSPATGATCSATLAGSGINTGQNDTIVCTPVGGSLTTAVFSCSPSGSNTVNINIYNFGGSGLTVPGGWNFTVIRP